MEKKENAVSVTYNPDCEFVIATVNAQSGVTNVTTGSISDVKKQSEVYLYGAVSYTHLQLQPFQSRVRKKCRKSNALPQLQLLK